MTGTRGLWSVITSNCCMPIKNTLNFNIAHVTASNSNSITAYLDSASVRQREPAWTRRHCPSAVCCCMTNPRPCLLASVHTLVGLATSNTGAVVKHSFVFASAWLCSVVHVNSVFVLRRGLSGVLLIQS